MDLMRLIFPGRVRERKFQLDSLSLSLERRYSHKELWRALTKRGSPRYLEGM
jgi:hypothetical protein